MNRIALAALALMLPPVALAQSPRKDVPCWTAYVAPEMHTVQCKNGYWITYMGDGSIIDGNGVIDPNATAQGSTITSGPGGVASGVKPPAQIPIEAPHQAPMWGQQPLQTR